MKNLASDRGASPYTGIVQLLGKAHYDPGRARFRASCFARCTPDRYARPPTSHERPIYR
jgi:hypothetical protein